MKMDSLNAEQEYLKQLAEIKWSDGFVCKRCNTTEFYNIKKTFARRCKNCAYEEAAIKSTMFEGSKLSIEKIFAIITDMQNTLSNFIAEKYGKNELDEVEITLENTHLADEIYGLTKIRDTQSELAKKFDVAENSIANLFERIANWIGDTNLETVNSNFIPPLLEWMKGLKDDTSKMMYDSLYNFLIYEGVKYEVQQSFIIPSIQQMLEMAVFKKPYFDWENL